MSPSIHLKAHSMTQVSMTLGQRSRPPIITDFCYPFGSYPLIFLYMHKLITISVYTRICMGWKYCLDLLVSLDNVLIGYAKVQPSAIDKIRWHKLRWLWPKVKITGQGQFFFKTETLPYLWWFLAPQLKYLVSKSLKGNESCLDLIWSEVAESWFNTP